MLAIVVAAIGWFLKWMVGCHRREIREVKEKQNLLTHEVRALEKHRQADQKYAWEQYVSKEDFLLAVRKTEELVGRIFDQLDQLNRSVNQIIGTLHAREKSGD